MLQTIEAILEPSGKVHLLESIHVAVPTRVIVTLLETPVATVDEDSGGDMETLLRFLRENRLPDHSRLSAGEIDAQIQAERKAEYDFLEELLNGIVRYASIPKLQIERVVGPILTLFIEDLLGKLQNTEGKWEDKIHLVSPEWPLKKQENYQSKNIDWLMVQPSSHKIFLVELKAYSGSGSDDQLEIYKAIESRVSAESAGFLLGDVEAIRNASSSRWKYNFILNSASNFKDAFESCWKVSIIYIVPKELKARLSKVDGITCYSFEDLPDCLESERNSVWQRIRKMLIDLEQVGPKRDGLGRLERLPYSELAAKIVERLEKYAPGKRPLRIWFGKTGAGNFPNYQVEFEDGSIQPFWYSGSPYTLRSRFKDVNIKGPYLIDDLLQAVQRSKVR